MHQTLFNGNLLVLTFEDCFLILARLILIHHYFSNLFLIKLVQCQPNPY